MSHQQSLIDKGLDWIGQVTVWLVESFYYLFQGRFSVIETYRHMAMIGFDGLPIAFVISGIAGAVLALQTAQKFAQTGSDTYVGGLVAIAIVREIAPIFTCLAVAAQSGTALAAELAHMRVTDQVDALKILQVDPIRYLMAPRVLACLLALPLMTILCSVVGVLGGMLVVRQTTHLHYSKFLESVWMMLRPYDIVASSIKAVVFGVLMSVISCAVGLRAKGSSKAVGESATLAAVLSALTIMLTDFGLSWLLFANHVQTSSR